MPDTDPMHPSLVYRRINGSRCVWPNLKDFRFWLLPYHKPAPPPRN